MFDLAKDFKQKKDHVKKFLDYFPDPMLAYKELKKIAIVESQ